MEEEFVVVVVVVVVVPVMLEAWVSARAARWGWRDEEDDEAGGWYCEERDCDWSGSAAAEEEVEDSLRERVRVAVELDVFAGAPATKSGKLFPPAPLPSPGASEGHRSGLTFFKYDRDVSTEELYASGSIS